VYTFGPERSVEAEVQPLTATATSRKKARETRSVDIEGESIVVMEARKGEE
jgi:hypothetical protein